MTDVVDRSQLDAGTQPGAGPGRPAKRQRRVRLWLVLFAIYCVGFGASAFVRFVFFDQSQATGTVPLSQYYLLELHVAFGAVAMCLAWMQVWPWLRATHPRVHRNIGKVYFFLGAIPAGLLALPVAIMTGIGQPYRMSLFVLGILWLLSTFFGLRAALRGQYAIHRRWMLRNVALTTAIITARPLTLFNWLGLSSISPDTYPIDAEHTYTESMATGMWCAVILHLIIVEWILLRPKRKANADLRVSV